MSALYCFCRFLVVWPHPTNPLLEILHPATLGLTRGLFEAANDA